MLGFFIKNHLISTCQSGFKLGDSSIDQLLTITHGIYVSLDEGYKVGGVFLEMSKAFDKVWHKDLILKVKQNRIAGKLLHLAKDFLIDRKQQILVLNGQCSFWMNGHGENPQGSVLGEWPWGKPSRLCTWTFIFFKNSHQ